LLVAASKTKPAEAILHAYSAGQRHFGENYVQELTDKAALPVLSPAACPGLVWHFIGHLQSNKVKQVARIPNLALVECIDSSKLASALDKACTAVRADALARPLGVLIQVNTSGEKSKFGCEPAEASALFEHVLRACPALEPRGLMTIGRLAEGPQPDCFDTLVRLRDEICAKFGKPTGDAAAAAESGSAAATSSSSAAPSSSVAATRTVDPSRFELSMGMSGDYALALEKGATEVRVGSTIFGAREYPNKPRSGESPTRETEQAAVAAAPPQ
jgi:pyridoxal phosphate enzyme (YggS family)